MERSSSGRGQVTAAVAVIIAAVAVVAIAAGASGALAGPTPSASPQPSERPVSTPVVTPSPQPTVVPSPPAGGLVTVDLDVATDHDVSVVIDDATGTIVKAASGRPGDGMSVRWFDSLVETVDAQSISVTWVGLPGDEQLELRVVERDGAINLDFLQGAPPAYSDATGFDRVLVITFDRPVDPADVVVTFTEATS